MIRLIFRAKGYRRRNKSGPARPSLLRATCISTRREQCNFAHPLKVGHDTSGAGEESLHKNKLFPPTDM